MNADTISPSTLGHEASRGWRLWWGMLGLALLLRLLTLPIAPLTDHTEARYGEIARLMVVSGDWISPHITPTEVFWAKPPLSTWSQAALMSIFGVHEWSGRLAAVLWSLMSLLALSWMLRDSLGRLQRQAVLVILLMSPLFFLCAGAVMTDATLGATVMLVQAAWWRTVTAVDVVVARRAGRWLALGLGLALLTKGIAAAALALLPVLMHAAWRRHGAAIAGILRDPVAWLICLGTALPWYIAAEIKTPGFLEYFVLGEHVMRFIQPGWKGDRYGFAHAQPLGMIWLYFAVAILPWFLLLIARLVQLGVRRNAPSPLAQLRGQLGPDLAAYALCMMLAPLLLFSAARNIIATYALTALPGFVILLVALWPSQAWRRRGLPGYAALVLVILAWAFLFKLPKVALDNTERELWLSYERACAGQVCSLRFVDDKPSYSFHFYSRGRFYDSAAADGKAPEASVAMGRHFEVRPANPERRQQALACNKASCLLEVEPPSLPLVPSTDTPAEAKAGTGSTVAPGRP